MESWRSSANYAYCRNMEITWSSGAGKRYLHAKTVKIKKIKCKLVNKKILRQMSIITKQ